MLCSACQTENAAESSRCSSCGTSLNRRPRRREANSKTDGPNSRNSLPPDPLAVKAYRLSVWALIPGVGLLLSPAALLLGILAWRQAGANPEHRRTGHVFATLFLSTLTILTNWLGLWIMWLGCRV